MNIVAAWKSSSIGTDYNIFMSYDAMDREVYDISKEWDRYIDNDSVWEFENVSGWKDIMSCWARFGVSNTPSHLEFNFISNPNKPPPDYGSVGVVAAETKKCICPAENFTWSMIGCKCGGL